MTIANKLTTIAENEPKVYDAGHKSGYREGYADGKTAEWHAFWDVYQQNGNRTAYTYAFYSQGWTDETFKPKYDIIASGNCGNAFAYARMTKIDVAIDFSGATTTSATNGFFANATSLQTIELLKFEKSTPIYPNMFTNCTALKNIDIEGEIGQTINFQYSPLSVASMKNIISCLVNYAGTDNEGVNKVTFTQSCWDALEADSSSPSGETWKDYVLSLGWLV